MRSYLWLKHGRRIWSAILNWWQRPITVIPKCRTLEDVEYCLNLIRWVKDGYGDWVQAPELTWWLRRGDCEDMARLAQALLDSAGIKAYLVSVILDPPTRSHAVCAFEYEGQNYYFDNQRLKTFGYVFDLLNLVDLIVDGNRLVCWSVEDAKGKITEIHRGSK